MNTLLILIILYINYLIIRRDNTLISPSSAATFIIFAKTMPSYLATLLSNNLNYKLNQYLLNTLILLTIFLIPFLYKFKKININIYLLSKRSTKLIKLSLILLILGSVPLIYLFKYNFELGWGMAYYNFKGFGVFHYCLLVSIAISSTLLINSNFKLWILPIVGFYIIYFLLLERLTNVFIFSIVLYKILILKEILKCDLKKEISVISTLIFILILYKGITSQGTANFLTYLIKDSDHLLLANKFYNNFNLEFSNIESIGYILKYYVPFSDRFQIAGEYFKAYDNRIAEIMNYSTSTIGGIGVPAQVLSIAIYGFPLTCLLTFISGLWMHYLNEYVSILFKKYQLVIERLYLSIFVGLYIFSFQQVGGLSSYDAQSYFFVIFFSIIFICINIILEKLKIRRI